MAYSSNWQRDRPGAMSAPSGQARSPVDDVHQALDGTWVCSCTCGLTVGTLSEDEAYERLTAHTCDRGVPSDRPGDPQLDAVADGSKASGGGPSVDVVDSPS